MENKKITFKRHYFFGGDKKDGFSDYIDYYVASTGQKIEIVQHGFYSNSAYVYTVNEMIFNTLKEAKEYIIHNYS